MGVAVICSRYFQLVSCSIMKGTANHVTIGSCRSGKAMLCLIIPKCSTHFHPVPEVSIREPCDEGPTTICHIAIDLQGPSNMYVKVQSNQ